MARKPKPLGGPTLTARMINLACLFKAQRLGQQEYTLVQLEQDSGLSHSVIHRAAAENPRRGPTIQTVRKLAETLEVALDRELEDRFYNAFGYSSPRQEAEVQAYVERKEAEEHELPPAGQ